MENEIVRCKHCGEVIIDCAWEEWTEFRNSKEAEIERHESECKENPSIDYCGDEETIQKLNNHI